MKTKAIVALAVASVLLTPIVGAKEVTRSDLFESTFSVGYKTRDVGSGVNLDVDWLFSENVGVYGSYNSISGDDIFDTQQQLTAAGLGDIVSETLYPIRFKYDRNYLEYGFSLRHVFYNALETPFAVYAKAGVVKFDYQDMVFLTADGANQESSSGSTDSGSSTTSEPDVEDSVTLEIPSTDAIKGSLGVKFFLNNRTTFDVSYSKYCLLYTSPSPRD